MAKKGKSMVKLKKIVVIGPESTGKSTLCEQLAQHFNTNWCPEFAREYLLTHGKEYRYTDLINIAKGQIALEEEYAFSLQNKLLFPRETDPSNLLFIDTNLYVMKVWSEFVFNDCDPWILNNIAERKYDLYLLCNTDLPWINDVLREYPDKSCA
jgi:NadR type nicotinamide-nucleotide adenylyltransferase